MKTNKKASIDPSFIKPITDALAIKLAASFDADILEEARKHMILLDEKAIRHLVSIYNATDWKAFAKDNLDLTTDGISEELTGEVTYDSLKHHLGELLYFHAFDKKLDTIPFLECKSITAMTNIYFEDDIIAKCGYTLGDIFTKNTETINFALASRIAERKREKEKPDTDITEKVAENIYIPEYGMATVVKTLENILGFKVENIEKKNGKYISKITKNE